MAARRILVILAVVMGVTALSAALAPPPRERVQDSSNSGEAGSSAGAGSIQERGAGVETIVRTISAEAPQAVTIEVPEGTILRLTVESQSFASVEIGGLDRSAAVAPEGPAEFELLLDRPGSYPVRLVETDVLIGQIDVSSQR